MPARQRLRRQNITRQHLKRTMINFPGLAHDRGFARIAPALTYWFAVRVR
jgi:hypothetical protein